MEINKKIILKLIKNLEELKSSIKDLGDIGSEQSSENIESVSEYNLVKSPIVGTAYLAPEPGAKKFIDIGKKIKKGDTVMIVEAMKTMNHVPSNFDGVVKKVSVEDGEPVEFGQILAEIE